MADFHVNHETRTELRRSMDWIGALGGVWTLPKDMAVRLLDHLDELDPPPAKKAGSGDMPLYVRCRESRDSLRGGAEEGGMFTGALVIELLDHLDALDPPPKPSPAEPSWEEVAEVRNRVYEARRLISIARNGLADACDGLDHLVGFEDMPTRTGL